MSPKIIPVGEISRFIRDLIAQEPYLRRVAVSGEVSNLTYHRSGHIYFTIKDRTAALSCVMWAGDRGGLSFRMKNGDLIVATGSVDVYLQQGKYQLYAKKIELQGAGLLYEKFLALKAELEEMGMFADEYKQPIPYYVRRLGVVTAPTGAAVQDIHNIAKRRNPYIDIILYPALVQGEGAAASIVRGIETLDALGLDCIIAGRGGGSIEDLWAFNEEEVARAIFNCRTPVISAVGHETDTTIADLVADLRAPTPSAAAELAVCDIRDLLARIASYGDCMNAAVTARLREAREMCGSYARNLRHLSPENQLREKRQRSADIEERLGSLLELKVRDRRIRLEKLGGLLSDRSDSLMREKRYRLSILLQKWEGLSPIRKLQQGYSYAEDGEGRNVSSINSVSKGDALHIEVTDGVIHTEVTGSEARERCTLTRQS